MLAVRVQNGTDAGRKTQRQPRSWAHVCDKGSWAAPRDGGRLLKTYSCPDCGTRRP